MLCYLHCSVIRLAGKVFADGIPCDAFDIALMPQQSGHFLPLCWVPYDYSIV